MNKKDAVNIGITLSIQLISASLTMIAVVGAFVTFVIDKRVVESYYYVIVGGSFFSFVASIYFGGKGIDKARKDGYEGIWNIINTKRYFNGQAFCLLVGIVFFTISVFIGREKNDDYKQDIKTLTQMIKTLQSSDSLNKIKINNLIIRLDSLNKTKPKTILPKVRHVNLH